jgi:uncharacterized protein YabE (DUF348 family)
MSDAATTDAPLRDVQLILNGTPQTIQTRADNPQTILAGQGLAPDASDRIWLDGTRAQPERLARWPVPVNEIVLEQRTQFTVVDGDREITLESRAATVGDALYQADIVVYASDTLTPGSDTPLSEGLRVIIDRARPVQIYVDGTQLETRVRGGTVGMALAEAGIVLNGLDYSVPAEDDPVQPGMSLHVVRVTEETVTYDEMLDYDVVYQADAQMELDARQTVQAGQRGIRRYSELVRYENGVEIAREPLGSELVQAPQNRVIAYGTKIVMRPVDTPEGSRQYWRKLRVYATSYHPAALGGDNVTAIGETLRKGIVAADPGIIPYRTDVFVPGYGSGYMADTGGPRSSPYWIDLGYSDDDYQGWHQYVDVYLLAPVPDNVNYLLPDWSPMRGLPDNG